MTDKKLEEIRRLFRQANQAHTDKEYDEAYNAAEEIIAEVQHETGWTLAELLRRLDD